MKKFLLSAGAALALLSLIPVASAQDYSYDCTCLYASPNGSCMEYTCDSYQRRPSYYNDSYYNDSCDPRYDYGCDNSYNNDYYNNNNYYDGYSRPTYNYDSSSYNEYNSSWTIRRNTSSRSPYRRYLDPYYDDQMYYY